MRLEGREKVTGTALYAADVPFDELAYGWVVLSTVARGRITSMGTAAVEAMPGVIGSLHHGNAPRLRPAGCSVRTARCGCSSTTGCRMGRPVALVVARNARAGAGGRGGAGGRLRAEEADDVRSPRSIRRGGHAPQMPEPAGGRSG